MTIDERIEYHSLELKKAVQEKREMLEQPVTMDGILRLDALIRLTKTIEHRAIFLQRRDMLRSWPLTFPREDNPLLAPLRIGFC
jgi:hypothetical protein